MKTRNGFVSNSSSSSFIVWGAKVKKETLRSVFKLTADDDEITDELYGTGKKQKITFEDTRFYFGGDTTDDMIVGRDMGSLDDGSPTELAEIDKDELVAQLNELGLEVVKDDIKLYV